MDAALRLILPLAPAHRARLAAWGATLALVALGMLLLARRAAGALTLPLGAGRLLFTVAVATAIVVAGRVAWRRYGRRSSDRERTAFAWTGTVALWALCLGCAPPSLHAWAWLLWLPLVGMDHVSRRRFMALTAPSRSAEMPTALRSADFGSAVLGCSRPFQGGETEHDLVVQEVTRTRSADGVESIHGTLRADFAAGQRHATLHVGFCPPLDRPPEIEVEIVDGPDATMKVTQVLAHGARLELRLAEPAEEACTAVVEFVAAPSAPLPRRG